MSWSGVKQQSINVEDIEAWCEEMGIENYTINSKGEIDVNGSVDLGVKNFKELPCKFGTVNGFFSVYGCKNLTSLKNCPDEVYGYFDVDDCPRLNSLVGCPKKVGTKFYCRNCKRKFSKEELGSLCEVDNNNIYI